MQSQLFHFCKAIENALPLVSIPRPKQKQRLQAVSDESNPKLMRISSCRLPSAKHVEIHCHSIQLHHSFSFCQDFLSASFRVRVGAVCDPLFCAMVEKLTSCPDLVTHRSQRAKPDSFDDFHPLLYDYVEVYKPCHGQWCGSNMPPEFMGSGISLWEK